MRLTFLGAAGEVTGSCYLVESGAVKFLVDCGMFQGGRAADAKNRRFAFDPGDIAFVLLTHAHIDHSGLIPRLVAQGFRGECAIVLVGFQAAGTLGRRIVDGAQSVRLFGDDYAVRARIFTINGLSAHAGRPAPLGWLGHFRRAPQNTWVVHGESMPAQSLCDAINAKPGWRAAVPAAGVDHRGLTRSC